MRERSALVTGATGGIGKEICKILCKNKYFVYINARNRNMANDLLNELHEIDGKGEILNFDINDVLQMKEQLSHITSLDILVNNSGISRDNLIYNMDMAEWDLVMNTNFYSIVNLYHLLTDIFLEHPIIINLASISGVKPRAGQASYAISKAMLINWTKNMAVIDCKKKFFAISPGPIETTLIKNTKWYQDVNSLNRIPLKRYGTPKEIAEFMMNVIKFNELFTNGSNFVLDGGFTHTLRE